MSIAVLTQVYDEARRLAVAGSVVAAGDFRLKKLIPPLEAAGKTALVFARVAEAATAVVEGPEKKSAENLLELTGLVSAVLYTQGETGLAGEFEPIPPSNLGGEVVQTPARLMKPLLEALTRTGSGRIARVKDAHQKGAFRDLRLVKPALNGIDDPAAEVAEFLADQVLPLYGPAVLPELKARYDPQGTRGHPRRLKLMHRLDPEGTRPLVEQALEDGSKEVKVAAIGLLGPDDLPFLVEQAASKTEAVREAAYTALAKIDDPKAVAVLEQGLAGKDFNLVLRVIDRGAKQPPRLTDFLVGEVRKGVTALATIKPTAVKPAPAAAKGKAAAGKGKAATPASAAAAAKKLIGETADRVCDLLRALPYQPHPAADALTRELFAQRAELGKIKGDIWGGTDVVEAVVERMADGPKTLAVELARGHTDLEPEYLGRAVWAARRALPPAEVYDLFSPCLTAVPAEAPKAAGAKAAAKKKTDPARERRNEMISALHDYDSGYDDDFDDDEFDSDLEDDDGPRHPDEPRQPPDPRWLDLALALKDLNLVDSLARPGHPAAQAFAWSAYDEATKQVKNKDAVRMPLMTLIKLGHPRAAEALLAAYEKAATAKSVGYIYWYYYQMSRLPKAAIPLFEAVAPKIKNPQEAERLAEALQEWRDKKEPEKKTP